MIHIGLYSMGIPFPFKIKIMGDKLIFPFIFSYDLRLSFQEIRNKLSLEFFKLTAKASVNRTGYAGKFFPGIDAVAPVSKAEVMIEAFQISIIFFPDVSDKHLLYIFTAGTEMLGFVIQLKSDDTAVSLNRLHQSADDALREESIGWMGDIHDLPGAVRPSAASIRDHDLRVSFCHPGRYGIGGGSHNNVNAFFFTGIQNFGHIGKIENTFLRFFRTPCGFRDPDYVDSGLFHHTDVFVQPFIRHVFIIICCSI